MSDMNRREFLTVAASACAFCALGGASALAAEGGTVDVGPLKNFAKDGAYETWSKSQKILVIHNEGKLYACSAFCTHKPGNILKCEKDELVCSKHGSRFSLHGTVVKDPANRSLARFAISVNDKGNVIVDKSKEFKEKEWDEAGAFIEMKKK